MSDVTTTASVVPEPNELTLSDLTAVLKAGWQDFRRAPIYGLFFSAVYVLGGWLIVWAVSAKGQLWWTLPASAGFPILGPFIACGFYEISRRLEAGESLDNPGILTVIFRQKDRQIPSMAAVIVVFFLFWNFLAHMIFALFMGTKVLTNISSSFEVFLTPSGLTMLAVGTAVGAVFAGVLFSLTVISLPLLLHREVDFVTAMITSFRTVTANPVTMMIWGAIIAVLLFAGMALWFLGLFIVLPVLGHATWHLYRRALD
ncbi:DUF2189 domain-containing protein [Aliigemmobacter aestuarii]|uniref:DUF2189 domain-containing protein n=1 Tax=Aliigemmobacter aestuarii TaxID=1445661 RepID=A0A4S3MP60_9RHOB|nr:DUF2189 domain-containing protein [Gemmobacter aestuarii]THD84208.1 DUF2189 domain-containing protein [Gemmobacter aestuarii]